MKPDILSMVSAHLCRALASRRKAYVACERNAPSQGHDDALWDTSYISSGKDQSHISCMFLVQMLFSVNCIIVSVFVSFTSAFSLPPSLSLTQTHTTNIPELTSSNLTDDGIFCTAAYGSGLLEGSCRNAWDKIDRSSTIDERFVPRSKVTTDTVPLPIRYLSDDGICAIDLSHRGPFSGPDSSTRRTISDLARGIIKKCVRKFGKGGSITHFSKSYLILGIVR